MKGTVLVTCLNNHFSEKLAAAFIREGYRVFGLTAEDGHAAQALEEHRVFNKDIVKGLTLLPFDVNKAAAALKEETDKLDFLLDTTDERSLEDNFSLRDGINAAVIEKVFRQNVLRSMSILEAFLPLLDNGLGKRLFYITRSDASINETRLTRKFGCNMSKAALHQFLQMTRNKLATRGYTFRVFDPMDREVTPEAAAESAFLYITRRRGIENNDPLRDDETNLVFRDAQGRQHSW